MIIKKIFSCPNWDTKLRGLIVTITQEHLIILLFNIIEILNKIFFLFRRNRKIDNTTYLGEMDFLIEKGNFKRIKNKCRCSRFSQLPFISINNRLFLFLLHILSCPFFGPSYPPPWAPWRFPVWGTTFLVELLSPCKFEPAVNHDEIFGHMVLGPLDLIYGPSSFLNCRV